MSYTLPTNAGLLLGLGNKMHVGLVELGQPLGITQITPAAFQTILNAFSNADNTFNAARSARQVASDTYQEALAVLDEWLLTTKNVLAGRFGVRWSTAWAQAGFVNHSTAIPRKLEDRIALAGRLVAFFTVNPTAEVPNMLVTAARGRSLQTAVLTSQATLMNSVRTQEMLSQSWTDAFTALSDKMWSLIKLLQATLDDDDPRWLAFGLPMPITPSTPGAPENVTAQLDATGAILVQCGAVALATRYRCRMLIVNVETDYRLVASGPAPMLAIAGVQPGQTVKLIVQAVNGSLQGVASEPILFTVPMLRTKSSAAEPAASVEEAPAAKGFTNRAGNGNGNGHAAATRVA